MATVTKAANAHTVVSTGWTNPTNAYSTTNDSTYATIATAKNSTLSGDFGFPAFTTSDIPDGATITSVVFFTTYGLSATATGALVGLQARRNTGGVTLGSEITRNAASMADANGTATGATLTDLRTANELRVRGRGTKGNSSTASEARIDRLYLTVTFTLNKDATVTGTGGGVFTASATSARSAAVTDTGGGVLTAAVTSARSASLAATGGGLATVDYERSSSVENHDAVVTATGGGIATVAPVAGRIAAPTLTGGGVATIAQTSARSASAASTGGGIAAVSAGTDRAAIVAATGAGIATAQITTARELAALLSGGGVLTAVPTSARSASIAATGRGIATVDGTSETVISASVVATGGGIVTVDWTLGHELVLVATGGGICAIAWAGDHTASVRASGGGRVTIDAEGGLIDTTSIARIAVVAGSIGRRGGPSGSITAGMAASATVGHASDHVHGTVTGSAGLGGRVA